MLSPRLLAVHRLESSGLTGGYILAESAQHPRFQGGLIVGGVLGTSTGLSMDSEEGTSCAGSEKWARSPCDLQQVTPQSSPALAPTSSTGIIVTEFLFENSH